MSEPINHEEAQQYAHLHPESNLARCYLDIVKARAALKQEAREKEDKYFVLKLEDLHEYLTPEGRAQLDEISNYISAMRKQDGREPHSQPKGVGNE